MALWQKLALVAAGGGIGSMLRWLLAEWSLQRYGPAFPWGTFIVNISGAFLIGLVMGVLLQRGTVGASGAGLSWKLLLCSGLIGGYTTFSALAWESLSLMESGAYGRAAFNLFGTVLIGMLAVWLGAQLGRAL